MEVDGLLFYLQTPRFKLRQIQDFIDQLEQVLAVVVHEFEQALLLLRAVTFLFQNAVQGPDHQRERSAQLVAHVGEEAGFEFFE